MPFPAQAGLPSYSGNFIPEIWSGKLVEKFYDATVLAAISNTDYEGEIKDMGDKVHIRTIPTLEVDDYVKGMPLRVQRPNSDKVILTIDKGKYFSAIAEDLDVVQSDITLMDKWSADASEQMKIKIDSDVLAAIPADVAASNKGATAGRISKNINLGVTGTPVQLTKANILEYIVDLGTVLDESNIPETGRFLVIPAWVAGMIKKSDLKDASLTGDGVSVMRNGRLGMIDRFTLYSSNLVYHVTDSTNECYHLLAGVKSAFTFATQLTKMETLRAESTFGNIIRGLQVFGYKTIKGDALADLYAYK